MLGVRHLLVLPHLHSYPFMLFVHCVGSVWSMPVLALEGEPREWEGGDACNAAARRSSAALIHELGLEVLGAQDRACRGH